MALKCEECGQMVSDKAGICPNCGCPISQSTQKSSLKLWKKIAIGFCSLITPLLMLIEFLCFMSILSIHEGFGVLLSYLFFGILLGLLNWLYIRWSCKKIFESIEPRLRILRFCGFIFIGIAMAGILTGLLYDDGSANVLSSYYNYSDIKSINEALGGTAWRSSGSGSDIEISFSDDGTSAKFRINRYESDYETPDSIMKRNIPVSGVHGNYVLIHFHDGVFALSNEKGIYKAAFAPITIISEEASYDYVGASLMSITKGVQEGAYAAALAALNNSNSSSSEKGYGEWIDMIKQRQN